MGTSLTGTKPKDTYDSLIKVGDNGPISGTAKYLSDGLGNDLPISVSTSNVGIGTAAPADLLHVRRSGNGNIVIVANDQTNSQVNIGVGVLTGGLPFVGTNTDSNPLQVGTRADTDMILVRNSTELARITANGLTFNGDTAAANALDDYEEGTWTMGIAFGGGTTGITYSFNTGRYTKIGRQVSVVGYVNLTAKGSSVGAASITGLPFTIANSTENYSVPSMRFNQITYAGQFQAYGVINGTTIQLEKISEAGVPSDIDNGDFVDTSNILIHYTYFV